MSRATLWLIGEAGDIRKRCEALIHHLEKLESLVTGAEALKDEQEAEIRDANSVWARNSQDHLDHAFEAVDQWLKQVSYALENPQYPRWYFKR